ncbi:MAG TPA: hypothetical protein VGV60_06550 [Candidatus Polarisedimenticolia bacterium]|jgi:hypothetical protein|nr:hypothetical protein [Candidatus Polarisedimenticolia bacterium]
MCSNAGSWCINVEVNITFLGIAPAMDGSGEIIFASSPTTLRLRVAPAHLSACGF